jgi:hypothetical protein
VARTEARLYCEIWDDEDFLCLAPLAQRAYLYLLSQADLAYDGVIPLRVRRWARKCKGLDADALERHLEQLQDNGFIVMDQYSEELLIRSLMRRDRVFQQPNIMRAAAEHTKTVESHAILRVLAAEVIRIRTENPQLTLGQDAALSKMEQVLAARGFAEPEPSSERPPADPPVKGYAKGSPIPSGNPSPKALGERGKGKGAPVSVTTDSPFPFPQFPEPPPKLVSLASGSPRKKRASRKTRIPKDFTATDEMITWAKLHTPLVDVIRETQKFRDWYLGRGLTGEDWVAVWRTWMLNAQDRAEQGRARASPADAAAAHGPGHQLFRPEDHT